MTDPWFRMAYVEMQYNPINVFLFPHGKATETLIELKSLPGQ